MKNTIVSHRKKIHPRIYLDHAATTPVEKKVYRKMERFFTDNFYNPSALYHEGVMTRRALRDAREHVAGLIGALVDEICFTSGGTESDNLAVVGTVRAFRRANNQVKPHIVTSAIEHPAILASCRALEEAGEADVTYVGVSASGIVDPKDVRDALRKNTVLVSIMHANNEIGTIQPLRAIAAIIRARRKDTGSPYPYFHTDACQSANYLDTNVLRLGVDMMTLNGSKIYGPKGVGFLYVKRDISIDPLARGGGQEFGLRAGTENVPGIIGLAEALAITEHMKEKEAERLLVLRDRLIDRICATIPGVFLNGDPKERLPNNVNLSIPRVESEQMVIELDAHGVACSARSACKSADEGASHVIMALGTVTDETTGIIRFTLGRSTRKADVDHVAEVFSAVVQKITEATL